MKRSVYRSHNRYREFLAAAKAIAAKISGIEGVVGILATGGIGRGYCDLYSDLDLIVYADAARAKEIDRYIAVGNLRYKGIELDTPVESYDRALRAKSPSHYWSQVMRWDRQNSKILYDRAGRIKNLLEEKLVFPDWERRKLMKIHGEGVTEHLIYNFDIWQKRGTPVNLAHCLIQAAEHLILWIYAKNGCLQPYVPKWLFYHLENGSVPEARHLATIKRVYTQPVRTLSEARKLREELITLAERIGIGFKFKSLDDLVAGHHSNWGCASEKTRHYLSW
jgi:hypothetical protein